MKKLVLFILVAVTITSCSSCNDEKSKEQKADDIYNLAENDSIFRNFEDARIFVHELNLKSGSAWKTYCKSGSKPELSPYLN